MSNPEYDLTRLLDHHLTALIDFRDGQMMASNCVGLLKRGLIEFQFDHKTGRIDAHKLTLTHRGMLARAGIVIGTRVTVQNHKHAHWNGKSGIVVSTLFFSSMPDGKSNDQVIRWSSGGYCIGIRLDDHVGEWCIYDRGQIVVNSIPEIMKLRLVPKDRYADYKHSAY